MAPEIRTGVARAARTSDIYSLGALLFHLLTGVHPKDATILDPWAYRSKVPSDLRGLVLEMTNLVPSMRPTAATVLARVRAQQPAVAAPIRRVAAGSDPAGTVTIALLLLLGIGIALAAD
jgi:serine/threonine protein kinase